MMGGLIPVTGLRRKVTLCTLLVCELANCSVAGMPVSQDGGQIYSNIIGCYIAS